MHGDGHSPNRRVPVMLWGLKMCNIAMQDLQMRPRELKVAKQRGQGHRESSGGVRAQTRICCLLATTSSP